MVNQDMLIQNINRVLDPFIGAKLDARTIEDIRQVLQNVLQESDTAVSNKFKFDVKTSDNFTVTIEPKNLYTAVAFATHRIAPEIIEDEGEYFDLNTGMLIIYDHNNGAMHISVNNNATEDQEHWDDADYVDGSP